MIVNSLFPVIWVIIIAILALGVLAWLEVKRKQRFLAARLFALSLAVFSVACLILNPGLSTRKSSDIIVLTPDYSKETLDSLLTTNPKSQVYKLPAVQANNVTEIKNYRALSDLKGSLFLLGEGIPQYMLEYADTSSLQYFSSPNLEGFIDISSNAVYTTNHRAELNGIVTVTGNHTLTLTGPGEKEDSIQINANHPQPFSLTFTPKTSGQYLYTLTASDSVGKIKFTEQVPIQVKEQKSLSILFLSDYPSAEFRFLKNFLEKKNHKLTLRYKISKDKYRTEFINTSQKSTVKLNKRSLQSFDLVLIDASSLTSLTTLEINALKEAMLDGLGILTLINTPALPKQANDFFAPKLNKVKSDSAQLLINKQLLKLPATPATISSAKKIFAIQREPSGRIVSGYYHNGLGKSGFQLLTNTFSLELAGEKEMYAELWSSLLESVARKEIKKYDLNFTTPFPYYTDEPIEFNVIAGAEKPTVKMDSLEIPLVEDPIIKNVWFGKIWAGKSGWNSLHIDQDSSQHNFFVSQPEGWRSLRVFNQQKSIRKLSSQKERVIEYELIQPVSRIFFFVLFLLAAGFLWLAPKL